MSLVRLLWVIMIMHRLLRRIVIYLLLDLLHSGVLSTSLVRRMFYLFSRLLSLSIADNFILLDIFCRLPPGYDSKNVGMYPPLVLI